MFTLRYAYYYFFGKNFGKHDFVKGGTLCRKVAIEKDSRQEGVVRLFNIISYFNKYELLVYRLWPKEVAYAYI